MTQPTQAQIEAAAKAAFDYDVRNSRTTAQWENARRFYLELCKYALTAAAQVGGSSLQEAAFDCYVEEQQKDKAEIKRLKADLSATIERCAQVAEQHHLSHSGEVIAAAIRRLKNAP